MPAAVFLPLPHLGYLRSTRHADPATWISLILHPCFCLRPLRQRRNCRPSAGFQELAKIKRARRCDGPFSSLSCLQKLRSNLACRLLVGAPARGGRRGGCSPPRPPTPPESGSRVVGRGAADGRGPGIADDRRKFRERGDQRLPGKAAGRALTLDNLQRIADCASKSSKSVLALPPFRFEYLNPTGC